MSETASKQTPPEQVDPTQNLKAEMDRKLENLNDQLAQIAESLKSQQSQPSNQPSLESIADYGAKSQAQEPNLADLAWQDPEKYAQIIEERAEKRIQSKLSKQRDVEARQNAVVARITQDFPEVNDPSSPLYKKLDGLAKSLSPEERQDVNRWENLVYRAAMEAGVKPRSLRSSDGDDFVMGSNSVKQRQTPAKEPELDPRTELFAQYMYENSDMKQKRGFDEFLKGVKEKAKRKDWKRRG